MTQGGPARWVLCVLCVTVAIGAALTSKVANAPLPLVLGFGVLGAILPLVAVEIRARWGREDKLEQLVRSVTAGSFPDLPFVRDLSPAQVGVHASVKRVPYVVRDCESKLAEDFGWSHRKLIVGPSMSGKTFLALHVAQQVFGGRRLLKPVDGKALKQLLVEGVEPPSDVVVWLDDLEKFTTGGALSADDLKSFTRNGSAVLATIRTTQYANLQPQADPKPPGADVAAWFGDPVWLTNWTSQELERLVSAGFDDSVLRGARRFGLSAYLGGGPQAIRALGIAETERPLAHTLVRMVADWRRIGSTTLMPAGLLPELIGSYRDQAVPVLLGDVEAALTWATTPIIQTVALLQKQDDKIDVLDYVLDHFAQLAEPIPDAMWQQAMIHAPDAELVNVGFWAYSAHKREDLAESAWRSSSDSAARNNLGTLLREQGRLDEAESELRRSAEAGDPAGMYNLASLLKSKGLVEEAEDLYREVVRVAAPIGAVDLGVMVYARGQVAEAERWFRLAADRGDAEGYYNLGVLLEACGKSEESELWFRKAAKAGHAKGMYNLGVSLRRRGELRDGDKWTLKAAEAGDGFSMRILGEEEFSRGDMEAAESWFAKAAAAGDVQGMYNYAVLLDGRGAQEAEQLMLSAAEGGHGDAMFVFGRRLLQRGDAKGEDWWRRGAEAGNPDAMFALGVSLAEEEGGAVGLEVLSLWRQAAETGHLESMSQLGAVCAQRGERSEAKRWLLRAAEDGDVMAMTNLGKLLTLMNEPAEAVKWFRRAADADDAEAKHRLGRVLLGRGEMAEAERSLLDAARQGYEPAFLELGAALATQDKIQDAEHWWRRAAEGGDTVAMYNLGRLAHERGEVTIAERWWREASENEPVALLSLGELLRERGDPEGAELLSRAEKAASDATVQYTSLPPLSGGPAGQVWALFLTMMQELPISIEDVRMVVPYATDGADMAKVAVLFGYAGADDDADDWAKKAAVAGDPSALCNVAIQAHRNGQIDRAERLYTQAFAAGAPIAINLGLLLQEKGELDLAEEWFKKSAEINRFPDGMFALAELMDVRGASEEADRWYREAATADSTGRNATRFGIVLSKRNKIRQAEEWFRRGAKAGDPLAMANLIEVLERRGATREAQRWRRKLESHGK